jgi:Flp pilus assembly protein TadD
LPALSERRLKLKERKPSTKRNLSVIALNRDKATHGVKWFPVLGLVCALVIGVYAWKAHSCPLESAGSAPQDSGYNLLVQGFRVGQLNLKREVPPALAGRSDFANVDWSQMPEMNDLSFYKGKLYLYFGVTPALVLFWPYVALTGHYLRQANAVVIFLSVGFLAGVGLLWAVWRRYFQEARFGALLAGALALGLANFAPMILGRCNFYEVALSCGYALSMLALAGVWKALHDPRHRWRWLAAASLAYGLALGARPSLLCGAIILLVPVAQACREKRRVWPLLPAACGPIVLMGLGLMVYNQLRFDNPLEFGENYQLPGSADQVFSPRFLWFNFQVAFLDPARWSAHFPFVHDIALPTAPKGYFSVEHPFGVLTNVPLVWLVLAAPLAWRSRPAEARSLLRCFLGALALLFGMCALTLCLYDAMQQRYELEFTAPLVCLAVIGILALERALAGQPVWRRAARCGWGLLLALSVGFNLLAACEMQAEANFAIGRDLLLAGRVDEGKAYLHKASELEPDDMEVHSRLGHCLMQAGRADEAMIQYQAAVQLKPDNIEARFNLGEALLLNGKADEAISQYQEILQIRPDDVYGHFCLGNALLQKGRVDEAITQYQRAAQIKPDFAEAYNNIGSALKKEGQADEAITQYQKAVQIKPDYAEAYHNLGNVLDQEGRVDEAITQYQKSLQLKPGYADAHHRLGIALIQKGRIGEAIHQYQEALQLRPAEPTFQNNLAWLLATGPENSLRNGSKAVELARQANRLTGGENPLFLRTLAAALAETGRFSEAVETAQHALRLAEAQSNAELAGSLQSAIHLYQAGAPFHSPAQTP